MSAKKVLSMVFVLLVVAKGLWASLSYTPSSPRTGETVTFTLSPSNPPVGSITWDFGDGSPGQSGTSLTVTHVYAAVGTYVAKATYKVIQSAIPVTDQATVQVTNPRQISFSPPQPKAGEPVTFSAKNYFSSCIHWDFGDGTVKNGTTSETHTYANAGTYTIRAYEECGTTYGASVTVNVAAQGITPPTQPTLAVTFVNLYFAGGKAGVSVAKDFAPLQAFADIQVTGAGLLQWQWLVDGAVVKSDTMAVSFGNRFTLDSGKVPGLPTAVPGDHRVTIRFVPQPAASFAIPAISYFVAVKGPAPVIRKVTPDRLAPGVQYKLDLEGTDLTPETEINFPAPVAVVKKANVISSTRAQVVVFIAPTAGAGVKEVTARNQHGQTRGPGQVTIGPPGGERLGPKLPPTTPRPQGCPDIAISEMKVTLISTQLGDNSVESPHDRVSLSMTLENVGTKPVPKLFLVTIIIKKSNGEVVFSGGDPSWSTYIEAPGSRFVIDGITDSFPHGVPTTYIAEVQPLDNECMKTNNQTSLTIDEPKLHPGGTPDLTLSIFKVEKLWKQEGDQFKGTCYFSADVTNIGSGYCGDGSRTVDLEFIRVQGNLILAFIRIPESELPGPGANKRFEVEVPDSAVPPGVTPVVAFINPAHNETNKANNWATNSASLNNDLESPLTSSARISFPHWGMIGRILRIRIEIRNLRQDPLQNLRLILLKNGEQVKQWKSLALAPGGSSGGSLHYSEERPDVENNPLSSDEYKAILTTNNDNGLPPDNTIMDSQIRPFKWMDLVNSFVQELLRDPKDGIGAAMQKDDKNIRVYSSKTKTKISPDSLYIYIEGKKWKWGAWHEFQASVWLKVRARNGQIVADVIDKKLTLGSEAEKILIAIFLPGIGYGIQRGIEKAFISAIPEDLSISGLPVSPCGIVLRDDALYLYYPY